MTNLVKIYLDDNKIKQLDNGLFNDLINQRELWLEYQLIKIYKCIS